MLVQPNAKANRREPKRPSGGRDVGKAVVILPCQRGSVLVERRVRQNIEDGFEFNNARRSEEPEIDLFALPRCLGVIGVV